MEEFNTQAHLIIDKKGSFERNKEVITAAIHKVQDLILNEFDMKKLDINTPAEDEPIEIQNKRELYKECTRILLLYTTDTEPTQQQYYTLSLICTTNAEFQKNLAKDATQAATLLSTMAKTFAANQ